MEASTTKCTNSACGRALFGAVPFCPYCGEAFGAAGTTTSATGPGAAIRAGGATTTGPEAPGGAGAAGSAAADQSARAAGFVADRVATGTSAPGTTESATGLGVGAATDAAAAKGTPASAAAGAREKPKRTAGRWGSTTDQATDATADVGPNITSAGQANDQTGAANGGRDNSQRPSDSTRSTLTAAARARDDQARAREREAAQKAAEGLNGTALGWRKAAALRRASWFFWSPRFKRALVLFWLLAILFLAAGAMQGLQSGTPPTLELSWLRIGSASLVLAIIFAKAPQFLQSAVRRDLARVVPELTPLFEPPVATNGFTVSKNGEQHGPFTSGELQQMHARGQINLMTMIWRNGMRDWKPAGLVPSATDMGPLSRGRLRRLAAVLAGEPKPPSFAGYASQLRKTNTQIAALGVADTPRYLVKRAMLPTTSSIAAAFTVLWALLIFGGSLYGRFLVDAAATQAPTATAPKPKLPTNDTAPGQHNGKTHQRPDAKGTRPPQAAGQDATTGPRETGSGTRATSPASGAAGSAPGAPVLASGAPTATPPTTTPAPTQQPDSQTQPQQPTPDQQPVRTKPAPPKPTARSQAPPFTEGMLSGPEPLHSEPDPQSTTVTAPLTMPMTIVGQQTGTDGQRWLAVRNPDGRRVFVESARVKPWEQWRNANTIRDWFRGFANDNAHVFLGNRDPVQLYGVTSAPAQPINRVFSASLMKQKTKLACVPQTTALYRCSTDQNKDLAELILLTGAALPATDTLQSYRDAAAAARQQHNGYWK